MFAGITKNSLFILIVLGTLIGQVPAPPPQARLLEACGPRKRGVWVWGVGASGCDGGREQIALIEAPGINTAFGCQGLTPDQWIICLLLGASCIPLNLLFRLVPSSLFPGAED